MYEPIRLRESTLAKEGPLLVSKALKIPALLDDSEMELLFQNLEREAGDFGIYFSQGVCKRGEGKFSKQAFLEVYQNYIQALKAGSAPQDEKYRPFFSSFLSVTPDILYSIPIEEKDHLIKATRPILQLQLNHIHFSKEDGEFRPMVFGSDSISWGIQFSYPQLFQDPKSQEIHPIRETPEFPNTALFKTLQKWMREATLPTSFIVDGKKKAHAIRIGKKCLSWIKNHPQLSTQKIEVYGAH